VWKKCKDVFTQNGPSEKRVPHPDVRNENDKSNPKKIGTLVAQRRYFTGPNNCRL
jgi:hypothetical protein